MSFSPTDVGNLLIENKNLEEISGEGVIWQTESCTCDFDLCNYNQKIPTDVPDVFAIIMGLVFGGLVLGIFAFSIYIYYQVWSLALSFGFWSHCLSQAFCLDILEKTQGGKKLKTQGNKQKLKLKS